MLGHKAVVQSNDDKIEHNRNDEVQLLQKYAVYCKNLFRNSSWASIHVGRTPGAGQHYK